ncbi:flavin reductase family protein [Flavobacterium humidisoli]|uniref:Iron-sulfur cluster-binding domain-containing protein n=1 Tax=Flavobacterium humidisoli TaxID=2937442 RepID=A0ABY4LSN1_9FLAO|nr:iron-sulfur cluster-binding domain-containing protein [Flavobacterium humidisoli]UPZ16077.1 iron-sulfur cluster-binding domain-containing protein [Flavobacterium humidisoli]
MKKYTLKVQEVRKETKDTVTVCFKQPGLKKIKYLAGQYLTLQFRINGRRYIRPYSFSSAPVIDSTLDITVKRVTGGIISNHINDNIKVDDVIEVYEPIGDFVFENSQDVRGVTFWGVGSGITPLFSMIKDILVNQPSVDVHLVYGNKSNSSIIFKKQFEQLKVDYVSRFKVWNFFSQEEFFEEDSHNKKGRIHKKFVEDLMKSTHSTDRHYICGPIELKKTVKKTLIELGYSENSIFSEDFELIKNPEDFKDILDQEVLLSFEGLERNIKVNKGKSVLEEALGLGIELPYSCQTGNCSTCKGILKSGQLKMIGLDRPRTDLTENEYLLCCSYPLTGNVCIEV